MKTLIIGLGVLWLLSRGKSEQGVTGYVTRKSGWFDPFKRVDGKRHATMPGAATGKSGVYFIKRKSSGKIVYIGSSDGRLKDTLYRHFREWTPKNWGGWGNIYYSDWENYSVKVILCAPGTALNAEKFYIRKYRPADNPLKYENLSDAEVKATVKAAEKVNEVYEATPW